MNRIIQGLWIGDSLSTIEILCINSFLYHGHEFHLYCYGDMKNVPEGTTICAADDIIPRDKIYRSDKGGLSSFSNFFRWVLLSRKGGIWVDLDVICLKKFDFSDEVIFGYQSANVINSAILGFPVDHFLPRVMTKACDDVNMFQPFDTEKTLVKKIGRKILFGKEKSRIYTRHSEPGGPSYFTKFLEHYDMSILAKPESWFYPIPYDRWADIFYPCDDVESRIEGSYCVHLWNEIVRNDKNIDSKNLMMDGTLIGNLFAKYG